MENLFLKGAAWFLYYFQYTGDIIRSVMYVDDTKLYISAEPNDAVAIDLITTSLLAINKQISN